MKAISIKGNSVDEIRQELLKSLSNHFNPALAIVFMSVKQDRKSFRELLHQHGIDVFGATSCGESINGFHSEGAIVMLLLDIPRQVYDLQFEPIGNRTIAETARELAKQAAATFPNPRLLLSSTGMNARGEYFDGTTLVQTMRDTRSWQCGRSGSDQGSTSSTVAVAVPPRPSLTV